MTTDTTSNTPAIVAPALPALEAIAPAPAALALRDSLLARARKGNTITSADSAARAGEFLKEMDTFTRTVEAARKNAGAPLLALTKAVNAVAVTLTHELDGERQRIGALLGNYQAEQERAAEEARRKAYEEQERIQREAYHNELAAKEEAMRQERQRADAIRAEQDRIAAEAKAEQDRLAAVAASATTTKARAAAEEAASRAAAEAEQQRQDALRAAAEAEAAAKAKEAAEAEQRRQQQQVEAAAAVVVVPTVAKLAGVSTRHTIEFEVEDIHALFDACPALCLITPNNAAIKAQLKQLAEGKHLPGVRHWKVASSTVRLAK
jgi:hypothetical protein